MTGQHDNYDKQILQQLTRIANALEKMSNNRQNNDLTIDAGYVRDCGVVGFMPVRKLKKKILRGEQND